MGVEPTRDCWQPLPDLKSGRPTGTRDSSNESKQVYASAPPRICTPYDVFVAHSAHIAHLVEELQNLDSEFAASGDLIANSAARAAPWRSATLLAMSARSATAVVRKK